MYGPYTKTIMQMRNIKPARRWSDSLSSGASVASVTCAAHETVNRRKLKVWSGCIILMVVGDSCNVSELESNDRCKGRSADDI